MQLSLDQLTVANWLGIFGFCISVVTAGIQIHAAFANRVQINVSLVRWSFDSWRIGFSQPEYFLLLACVLENQSRLPIAVTRLSCSTSLDAGRNMRNVIGPYQFQGTTRTYNRPAAAFSERTTEFPVNLPSLGARYALVAFFVARTSDELEDPEELLRMRVDTNRGSRRLELRLLPELRSKGKELVSPYEPIP